MGYATYYLLVTLVFKNLDSHRGSLRLDEILELTLIITNDYP